MTTSSDHQPTKLTQSERSALLAGRPLAFGGSYAIRVSQNLRGVRPTLTAELLNEVGEVVSRVTGPAHGNDTLNEYVDEMKDQAEARIHDLKMVNATTRERLGSAGLMPPSREDQRRAEAAKPQPTAAPAASPAAAASQLVSVAKAAELTGYSKPRVQRAISQGQLVGATKIDGKWAIPTPVKIHTRLGDLVEWKRSGAKAPSSKPARQGEVTQGQKVKVQQGRTPRLEPAKEKRAAMPSGPAPLTQESIDRRR